MVSLGRVLIAITAGAVISVVAAWGCAAWAEEPQVGVATLHPPRWPHSVPPTWRVAPFDLVVCRSPGVTWTGATTSESWAIKPEESQRQWSLEAGWPWPALECYRNFDHVLPRSATGFLWIQEGARAPGGWTEGVTLVESRFWGARVLPLVPMWPGVALDVLFWAAVVVALWWLAGAARRLWWLIRRRCPGCGYDSRHVRPCPECGASSALRGLLRVATPSAPRPPGATESRTG